MYKYISAPGYHPNYIVCACSVALSCPTLCDLMDCSPPGSSVPGFSRQEYWIGLTFPSRGHLPNPGIESTSLTSICIGRPLPYHQHHLGSPIITLYPLPFPQFKTCPPRLKRDSDIGIYHSYVLCFALTTFTTTYYYTWASLVAQMVKHLSATQETWVWSLGWEDALEKEMATHSSILAWTIPWTVEPSGLLSMGSQRVGHDWATSLSSLFLALLYSKGSSVVS